MSQLFWVVYVLHKTLFLLGLVFLWRTFGKPMLLGLQSRKWQSVMAQVTRSGIRRSRLSSRNGQLPDVAYRYEIDGRTFTGDCYTFPELPCWDVLVATRLAAKYPVGSQIRVFVDPLRPERSVINRGVDTIDVVCIVFLLMMALLFTFIVEILALVLPH